MTAKLEKFVPFKNPFVKDNNALKYVLGASIVFSFVFFVAFYNYERNTRSRLDTLSSTAITGGTGTPGENVFFEMSSLIGLSVQNSLTDIPNAFGTLTDEDYVFSGTFTIDINSVVSPPANNYFNISIQIGSSTVQDNFFTVPSQASTFAQIPISYVWNTSSVDGVSPNIIVDFQSPNTITTGNLTFALRGIMIPVV